MGTTDRRQTFQPERARIPTGMTLDGQPTDAGAGRGRSAHARPPWLHAWLLTTAALVCYANSLRVPFLFDDPLPAKRLYYGTRPLVWATFDLNRCLSGGDTWSYHLFNVLVHLGCGLLLLGCLRRSAASVAPHLAAETRNALALVTALLWLCHPLQTAAVTYLSQRAEALAAFFYLATFYAFLRARAAPRRAGWSALCLVCLGLGLATKEMVATAPLFLLLADLTLLDGSARENWRRRRGFFALVAALALALSALFILPSLGAKGASAGFAMEQGAGPLEYARSQPGVLLHYLGLAFWPHPLVFDYAWPIAREPARYVPQAAVLLALVLLSVFGLAKRSWIGFSACAFFLILAPTSSFVPIKDLALEHRVYLPLAALSLLCVVATWWAWRRIVPSARIVPVALAGAGVLVLTLLTVQRNQEFSSALRLWATVVERAPHNDRAYTNLGAALLDLERLDEATEALETALSLNPTSITALQNMGVACMNRGDAARAHGYFERALTLKEDSALSHGYMARSMLARGDNAAAEQHFRRVLEIDPTRAGERFELAELLLQSRRTEEALVELEATLRAAPGHADAHLALGQLLCARGQPDAARAHLERACAVRPDDALARLALGQCLAAQGELQAALTEFRTANALRPTLVESRADAARILCALPGASAHERAEALRLAQEANRLTNPKRAALLEILALAHAALGASEAASAALEQALALPGCTQDPELAQRLRAELAALRNQTESPRRPDNE